MKELIFMNKISLSKHALKSSFSPKPNFSVVSVVGCDFFLAYGIHSSTLILVATWKDWNKTLNIFYINKLRMSIHSTPILQYPKRKIYQILGSRHQYLFKKNLIIYKHTSIYVNIYVTIKPGRRSPYFLTGQSMKTTTPPAVLQSKTQACWPYPFGQDNQNKEPIQYHTPTIDPTLSERSRPKMQWEI